MTDKLRAWLCQRFSRIGGTQVNEDGFSLMKHERMLLKDKKERRAARSLAYVLHRRVLGKVHKYAELKPAQTAAPRGLHLSSATFKAGSSKPSMDFRRLSAQAHPHRGGVPTPSPRGRQTPTSSS